MKKKFFYGIAVLAFAVVAAFNVTMNFNANSSSDSVLVNIEVLARGEHEIVACQHGVPRSDMGEQTMWCTLCGEYKIQTYNSSGECPTGH